MPKRCAAGAHMSVRHECMPDRYWTWVRSASSPGNMNRSHSENRPRIRPPIGPPGRSSPSRWTLTLRVSGGSGPYSCAGRSLPAGLFLNPLSCVVSGRAWGVGTFAVEVTATDSTGAKTTASFPWTVSWF
ncbi:Ig domain-containing protein [Embleya sp. NPDC005971]|uniref:Ig domain-containing protein n=1 Tax=Embleya sp. NPDC005971 TaxID=3156724 RepID=UPI0033CD4B96